MRAARTRGLWVLVLVCLSQVAAADPARRILLDPGSQPSLSRKIGAEASQAGLSVSLLDARSVAGDDDAAHLLSSEPDVAAVVTLLTPRKVGIYVPSPSGVTFEILSSSAPDAGTFPLRIVEHLRARLSTLPPHEAARDEIDASPAPAAKGPAAATGAATSLPQAEKPADPAPAGASPAQAEEPSTVPPIEPEGGEPVRSSGLSRNDERGFWLEGGAAYGARPGGFESGWRAALGARYAFDSLSLGAVAMFPLTTSEFREGASSARADSWSFLLKGAVHDHPDGNLGLSGGPGIGLVVQQLQGAAPAPLETRDDTVFSAALFAHGDVSWALAPWLRVALAVQAGAIVPRVAVRFEGREVTATGTWFADALLVARLRLAPTGSER